MAAWTKRGKLVSYFINNAAKTCSYGLKISENIKIGHFFQSRPFFHLNSNLHTRCLSAFKSIGLSKKISVVQAYAIEDTKRIKYDLKFLAPAFAKFYS